MDGSEMAHRRPTSEQNGFVPSEQKEPLNLSNSSHGSSDSIQSNTIKLKKTLGLFNGVAIIVGTIVGSGIFVSPKGVLIETGSTGLALVVWITSGVICMIGAYSFAELGTCIRKSGGMYAYIQEAFGDLAGFIYLWAALVIIFPAANAVIALTCAHYILYPLYPTCDSPDAAVRLLAAAVIALLTFVNCASVQWAARVQDVFTIIKVLALVMIIITGVVVLCQGKIENFQNSFENSTRDPGKIALAFYSGLFSYSGWYTLNFLTEELKNPYKNLPLAIWISMPLVAFIYVMANVAYFAVLNPQEVIESDAVAVSFAMRMFGVMSWLMPILVAFSTFGSLNGCILSVSRVFFVGARQGHLPDFLALISITHFTPMPSVLFEGLLSLMWLVTSDVFLLINYVTFIEALSFLACTMALFYFRWKRPDMERPIKVNLANPIIFFIACMFLVIFPMFINPVDTFIACAILLSGIPVYYVGVKWKNKPKSYNRLIVRFTHLLQYATFSALEEKYDHKDELIKNVD